MPARYNARPFGVGPAKPGTGRLSGNPTRLSGSLAAAAALLAASLGLQSTPVALAEESSFRSPAEAGAWAMQFRVVNDFQLSSFKGTVLSLKRHSSPGTAIRVGVSGDLTLGSSTRETELPVPATVESPIEEEREYFSLNLNAQRLKYTRPAERLSLFWGIGPAVGFTREDQELTRYSEDWTPIGESTVNSTSTQWSAGLGASLGVEWFATRHLGLHAEYGLAAIYSWTDQTQKTDSSDGSTKLNLESNSFQIDDTRILFGLSAYF